MLEEPELPEELVVVEDSRESLQSVDSNSSSNGSLDSSEESSLLISELSAEDSDDMSVTNSKVESAMNHRCRRAALCDPGFSKEAFNAFSSADAYI